MLETPREIVFNEIELESIVLNGTELAISSSDTIKNRFISSLSGYIWVKQIIYSHNRLSS